MSEPSRKRVRTLDSFSASTRSPSQADALQNDTEDSSTDGEQIKGKEVADESSERKVQIFSVLKRPSEMENVPQKITLRDKLTLSRQILAQTLLVDLY